MINVIDLFAGCGGLTEGFAKHGAYNTIACVEWEKLPYNALVHRFTTKYKKAASSFLRFDIQRVSELLGGWNDSEFGQSNGLDSLVAQNGGNVDLIIGGPPCQAYSVAGRVRDANGMKNDYRNYLFESYLKIVQHYQPKAFIFENVPGILSAKPGDTKIINLIKKGFSEIGYTLLGDLKDALIDFTDYGVPQNRKRVIILGLNNQLFSENCLQILEYFYNILLPSYKITKKATVREAIGDLPKLYPLDNPILLNGKKYAHFFHENSEIMNHVARYNSKRELDIFRLLTEDIESGRNEYVSIKKLQELYTAKTGKSSNVHKYYVLRWDEPSNTIPAHLYKDGLRHIHPDSRQLRTITVREAARLQTFPDDFEFISKTAMDFKIIGNAVPPLFSEILANAMVEILFNVF
ncbi:MAG: DNA cytosine methyltransferase [Firmicutes bacterium]|nr:DNA cytosine methyltransferase [Bacillota bacterium]